MVEHTSDVYLHNNDDISSKDRISNLESKLKNLQLILEEVGIALETTYKYMENQNNINDRLCENYERHERLLINLSESVKLLTEALDD